MLELKSLYEYEKSIKKSNSLIFFTAPWCEPCKILINKLTNSKKISKTGVNFFKINTDNEEIKKLVSKYKISMIPIIFLMVNGVKKASFTNTDTINEIVDKINHFI